MGKIFLSVLAVLLAVLATYFGYLVIQESGFSSKNTVVTLDDGARLEWQDCWFSAGNDVHCARMYTAPSKESGKSAFSLPVVVFRYSGYDRKDDAVVNMAGGPGASSFLEAEQVEGYWEPLFKEYNLKRDMVLFDQRGAGLSDPNLNCPDYYEALRKQLTHNFTPEENARLSHDALKGCYDTLKKAGVPLDEVSTLQSANDVKDLMHLLGYRQWNLLGASYSTRLATVIEQQNHGQVRSMILDSVYPVQRHFFKEWPALLDNSLKRIFKFCEDYDHCKTEYGDIEKKFWATMGALRENPLEVKLRPGYVALDRVLINDETFLSLLFQAEYESGILYDLPAVIDAFHDRDVAYLQVYIYDYLRNRLDQSMSEMVFWSIECKDNPPLKADEVAGIYQKYPLLKRYLAPEYDPCDIWRGGGSVADSDLKKFTRKSDTPVLLLAGEDDPVTPAKWTGDIIDQYKNSQVFRFPNVSHSVMDTKGCASELLSQFVSQPFQRPAADCRDGPPVLDETVKDYKTDEFSIVR